MCVISDQQKSRFSYDTEKYRKLKKKCNPQFVASVKIVTAILCDPQKAL